MSDYCSDCGCKAFNGHCVNCHEESFIFDQNDENDEPIEFSANFLNKVRKQDREAKNKNEELKARKMQREGY